MTTTLEIPPAQPLFNESSDSDDNNAPGPDDASDSGSDDAATPKKKSGSAKPRKKSDAPDASKKKQRSGRRRNPEEIGDIDPKSLLRLDLGNISDAIVRAILWKGKYYVCKVDVSNMLDLDPTASKYNMPGEVKGKIGGSGSGTVFWPFDELSTTNNDRFTKRPHHTYFTSHKNPGPECFVPYEDHQVKKKKSAKPAKDKSEKTEKQENEHAESNGKQPLPNGPPAEKKKPEKRKAVANDAKPSDSDAEIFKFVLRLKRLASDFDEYVSKKILVEKD